jgi:protein TonB
MLSACHAATPVLGRQMAVVTQLTTRRSARRQADRARIHARVVHPIDTPHLTPDPLVHRESRLISVVTTFRLLIAALVVHAGAILLLALISNVVGQSSQYQAPERMRVRITEEVVPTEEEPPPVAALPTVEGPVRPDFSPAPTEPAAADPPKPPPMHEPPTSEPADPNEPPPEQLPRRIVGLSLESTVTGSGPAFAVGTSRRGKTERRAKDPKVASRAPTGQGTGTGAGTGNRPSRPEVREQREASRIPSRDAEFKKPRRLTPNRPPYPPTLKAQGIEGDVTMRVQIAEDGRVEHVSVIRSSGHQAFDDTARRAARAERFAPATRDGKPVPFTLTYSYRFRIDEQ